jgi:hypothetical protein
MADYWDRQLASWPAPLNLPFDREVANGRTRRGSQYKFTINDAPMVGIRNIYRTKRVSMFACLFGA